MNGIKDNITAVESNLLAIARRRVTGGAEISPDELAAAFSGSFGQFDWQNYVPEPLRRVWSRLSLEAMLAIYICAIQSAFLDDPPV